MPFQHAHSNALFYWFEFWFWGQQILEGNPDTPLTSNTPLLILGDPKLSPSQGINIALDQFWVSSQQDVTRKSEIGEVPGRYISDAQSHQLTPCIAEEQQLYFKLSSDDGDSRPISKAEPILSMKEAHFSCLPPSSPFCAITQVIMVGT